MVHEAAWGREEERKERDSARESMEGWGGGKPQVGEVWEGEEERERERERKRQTDRGRVYVREIYSVGKHFFLNK